jgi:hypothetical protein
METEQHTAKVYSYKYLSNKQSNDAR